jgi:hypothetical protein
VLCADIPRSTLLLDLAGCSQAAAPSPLPAGGSLAGTGASAKAKIVVTPSSLSLVTDATASVVVSDSGYTGIFKGTSAGSACKGIVHWTPPSGKGPKLTVGVLAEAPGACTITLSDAKNHATPLRVTVQSPAHSKTFTFTGAPQNFSIPDRIKHVTITAAGGGLIGLPGVGGYSGGGGGGGGGVVAFYDLSGCSESSTGYVEAGGRRWWLVLR